MNFYLLKLVTKWISFLTLSIMTSFGGQIDKTIEVDNKNLDKNINVSTEIVEYNTLTTYDSSLPSNVSKVVKEGQEGLIFRNNLGEVIYTENAIDKEIIKGSGSYGIYNGITTGYGPDCATCSGRGFVACRTIDKKAFNLINDGVYYNDSEYGEARVMAAALSMFPCGTIIEVESSNLGNFTGIVLDTGYDMRKNYEKGIYHFDVAYKTEKDESIGKATNMSGNVVFNVQRWGW